MIRLALKAKGYQNITIISDSEIGCGLPNGDYRLGDRRIITVKDGLCVMKGTDSIAGGAMSMADSAKNLFRMGVPPEQIAVMASSNPAKVCGCDDRGRLIPGCRADIVIFDKDFNVKTVFLKGKEVK
ncbi:MAG: hypothetical protein E7399_07905 [Ruminococcaceae bacterium]|nr:hypothetical protein [Oscillospiraceae bacterium]